MNLNRCALNCHQDRSSRFKQGRKLDKRKVKNEKYEKHDANDDDERDTE